MANNRIYDGHAHRRHGESHLHAHHLAFAASKVTIMDTDLRVSGPAVTEAEPGAACELEEVETEIDMIEKEKCEAENKLRRIEGEVRVAQADMAKREGRQDTLNTTNDTDLKASATRDVYMARAQVEMLQNMMHSLRGHVDSLESTLHALRGRRARVQDALQASPG